MIPDVGKKQDMFDFPDFFQLPPPVHQVSCLPSRGIGCGRFGTWGWWSKTAPWNTCMLWPFGVFIGFWQHVSTIIFRVQVWHNAKATHLIARDGHSREAPLALTPELLSWNISIVNPTCIRSPGDVSNSLGIFAVGARGTSTNMGVPTQFHKQTPTDHFEKNRGYQHLAHTDAWIDSRRHHFSPSWRQTCFQHPSLRGWTGALRSGQGRSDVRRKNWCLMGIWNGWSSGYRILSISGIKPSNDLGFLHWLKKHSYVKTCQKMSLVEVVCDVF